MKYSVLLLIALISVAYAQTCSTGTCATGSYGFGTTSVGFGCAQGNICNIGFASFGMPNGDCTDPSAFTINDSCHYSDSMNYVTQQCDGKPYCEIHPSDIPYFDCSFKGDGRQFAIQSDCCDC